MISFGRKDKEVTINITNRTMVRSILWVVLAVLTYRFIGRINHALILIGVAAFLALAINPVVGSVRKRLNIKSRVRATVVAYFAVILIIVGFLFLVVPPLINQSRIFVRTAPQTVQNFQNQDTSLSRVAKRYKVDEKLSQAANDFTSKYSNFGGALLDTGKRVVGAAVSVLAVLALTFMMLIEGPSWAELFFGLVPKEERERTKRLTYKIYGSVSGFVNGQVILALMAGTFSFVALEIASNIMNVPINALALAGIVTAFGIIPLFGNPISSAIVILVCSLSSVPLALVMLVYFIVYYQIENLTFQPFIQSRLNQLTALSVFMAALIGISFAGFLGALIAIPAASAAKILLEDYFERNRNLHSSPTQKLKA